MHRCFIQLATVTFQQIRTDQRQHSLIKQRLAHEIVINTAAKPQAHIHFVNVEIHQLQAGCDAQFDLRIFINEAINTRREPLGSEGGAAGDNQDIGLHRAGNRTNRALQPLKTLVCSGVKPLACRRQRNRTVVAFEKLHLKVIFQLPYLIAQGRWRHEQFACCFLKAHQPRRRFESAQGIERGQTIGHQLSNPFQFK
ncbi:hypothetical protein R2A130_0505 [Ahrensia sp. R2A130]|nr:hypothetical protein R2A130_0505 [Ahrensia sp. R2A130]